MAPAASSVPRVIGRYALYGEIASGGMATVHFGRLLGPAGFSRTVAIKRLHAHLAKDPDFVSMFLDEARLAARVRHPNVVPTLDVVREEGELFLVMEYVRGESLSRLVRAADHEVPLPVIVAIMSSVLHGLHAAHEATDERGEPLDLVHRDVSPQNVLVGVDGVARVVDFGVAKAVGRLHTTRDGSVKGKPAYMAPEQLTHGPVDRRADIFAAGVVLWELLTGERLFTGDSEALVIATVLDARVEAPSTRRPGIPRALDQVTLRALSRNPSDRFGTARQMARALEEALAPATSAEVGEWVEQIAYDTLDERSRIVSKIETNTVETEPTTVVQIPQTPVVTTIPQKPRRSRVWIAFVAGLLVAALVAFGVRSMDRAPEVPAEQPMPSTPTPSVEAIKEEPPPPAPPTVTASATATATTTTKKFVSHPKVPTAHPTASADCPVKSYVDSAGVKHYFKDCSGK